MAPENSEVWRLLWRQLASDEVMVMHNSTSAARRIAPEPAWLSSLTTCLTTATHFNIIANVGLIYQLSRQLYHKPFSLVSSLNTDVKLSSCLFCHVCHFIKCSPVYKWSGAKCFPRICNIISSFNKRSIACTFNWWSGLHWTSVTVALGMGEAVVLHPGLSDPHLTGSVSCSTLPQLPQLQQNKLFDPNEIQTFKLSFE